MNKAKILLLSFISSVLTFLTIGSVSAQGVGDSIGDVLETTVGWIKLDLSAIGGPSSSTFYARFLLWIFLFAALYFAAGFVFPDRRKIQITIAAALSIIGAAVMPGAALKSIFQSYFLFFYIILIILPIVAVFFLSKKVMDIFPDNLAAAHMLSALSFLIAVVLLRSLGATLRDEIGGLLGTHAVWFNFAVGICSVMLIWHIFAIIVSFGGKVTGKTWEGGANLADRLKTVGGAGPAAKKAAHSAAVAIYGEEKILASEISFLKKIKKHVENAKTEETKLRAKVGTPTSMIDKLHKGTIGKIKKELEKADEILDREEYFSLLMQRVEAVMTAKSIAAHDRDRTTLNAAAAQVDRHLIKDAKSVKNLVEELIRHIDTYSFSVIDTKLNEIIKSQQKMMIEARNLFIIIRKIEAR